MIEGSTLAVFRIARANNEQRTRDTFLPFEILAYPVSRTRHPRTHAHTATHHSCHVDNARQNKRRRPRQMVEERRKEKEKRCVDAFVTQLLRWPQHQLSRAN